MEREDPMATSWASLQEQVLQELARLEHSERRDYELALTEEPVLVHTESAVDDFLLGEAGNATRAAHRLARYWKVRRAIFGEDRWLRPLNQTGRGALSTEDVALLRTGFMVVQPVDYNDFQSGVVVLVDMARMPAQAPQSVNRILFYYSVLYARWAMLRTTIVHVVTSAPRPVLSAPPKANNNPFALHRLALPEGGTVVPKFLIAQAAAPPGTEHLTSFLAYSVARTEQLRMQLGGNGQHGSSNNKMMMVQQPPPPQLPAGPNLIVGQSAVHTRDLLGAQGVPAHLLPPSLGGRYDYGRNFSDWVRQQLTIETPATHTINTTAMTTPSASFWSLPSQDQQQQAHYDMTALPVHQPQQAHYDLTAPTTQSPQQALAVYEPLSPTWGPTHSTTTTTTTVTTIVHAENNHDDFFEEFSSAMMQAQSSTPTPPPNRARTITTTTTTITHNNSDGENSSSSSAAAGSSSVPPAITTSNNNKNLRNTTTTKKPSARRTFTYQKHNAEIKRLKTADIPRLKARNQALRSDNRRLEHFLAQARLMVAVAGAGAGG